MNLSNTCTLAGLLTWLKFTLNCLAWSPLDAVTRRQTFCFGAGALSTALFPRGQHKDWAFAAGPSNPAEAVRRGAANIPGYGQTDVFYPPIFLGNWKAVREILPNSGGSGSGLTLQYPIRFIRSIEDNAVIADRGWNQANLEKSIHELSAKSNSGNNAGGDPFLPSYQWTETDPNDLRLSFADGSKKDIKVTKRATEMTDETVFSSEFQRVTQTEDDGRAIPVITARRVMSKWKVIDSSTLEGIEVVYDVGGGDPMSGLGKVSDQNNVLSKSRLKLYRQ